MYPEYQVLYNDEIMSSFLNQSEAKESVYSCIEESMSTPKGSSPAESFIAF